MAPADMATWWPPARRLVLDSSAVLAWVRGEPGADLVGERLATAVISAVNWSETVQKFVQHGVTVDRAIGRLELIR